MIDPQKVASAILDAAADATRDTQVGAMSVINTTIAKLLPALGDVMAKLQIGRQQRDEPQRSREGTLYRGGESGRTHGRGNENAADTSEGIAFEPQKQLDILSRRDETYRLRFHPL